MCGSKATNFVSLLVLALLHECIGDSEEEIEVFQDAVVDAAKTVCTFYHVELGDIWFESWRLDLDVDVM